MAETPVVHNLQHVGFSPDNGHSGSLWGRQQFAQKQTVLLDGNSDLGWHTNRNCLPVHHRRLEQPPSGDPASCRVKSGYAAWLLDAAIVDNSVRRNAILNADSSRFFGEDGFKGILERENLMWRQRHRRR